MLSTFQNSSIITHPSKDCKEKDESSSNAISLLQSTNEVLLDFLVTVKAVPHECVIRTGQP